MATWKMPPLPPKPAFQPKSVDFTSEGAGAEVLRVLGAKALAENILMLPLIAREAAAREMAIIAHDIIVDAQINYVPVQTGNLSRSGDSDPYVEGSTQQVTSIGMWFGGVVSPEALSHGVADVRKYALEQHEDMMLDHSKSIGGPLNGAKYLERPFVKMIPEINKRISVAVAAALNSNPAFINLAISEGSLTSVDPSFGGGGL